MTTVFGVNYGRAGDRIEFDLLAGPDVSRLTQCSSNTPDGRLRMLPSEFQDFIRGLQDGHGGWKVVVTESQPSRSRWIPTGTDGQQVPRARPTDPGYEPDSEDPGTTTAIPAPDTDRPGMTPGHPDAG